jgi:hypothetical protein
MWRLPSVLSRNSIIFFLLGFCLVMGLAIVNLSLPAAVQAGPLAGFTPSPGDNGDGDNDNDDPPPVDEGEGEPGRTPTDYVMIQLEQCDRVCAAGPAGSEVAYQPLAHSSHDQAGLPPLLPLAEAAPVEVQAPVRLVHEGSGFITEGTLSTLHSSRLMVPYPGRWEVFMTGQPQFMTAETVDVSGTNLADLQSVLANGPVSLGQVEANTAEPQWVKCPITCVIEPPAVAPPNDSPHTLPETGGEQPEPAFDLLFALIGVFVLSTAGAGLARAAMVINRFKI